MNSVRKARAAGTFWTGILILAAVVVCALLERGCCMGKYNDYVLPNPPAYDRAAHPYALVTVRHHTDGTTTPLNFYYSAAPFLYVPGAHEYENNVTNTGYTVSKSYKDGSWNGTTAITKTAGDMNVYPDDVIWCNVDILDDTGAVFLAGSKIEYPTMRSWLTAYLAAQCAPPLKLPDKQPTAYSYNGVVLPKLPEWDKTVYPYVTITFSEYGFGYFFRGYTDAMLYNGEYGYFADGEASQRYCHLIDGEWGDLWTNSTSYSVNTSSIVWTNTDILNEDGTIYLAASDPIPVYE
jgi:hypothetical protein